MEVEWAPARDPDAQAVWRAVLLPVAGELRSSAAELAVRSVAYMRAELPELFADAGFVEENRASTEASLVLLADVIERAGDPRGVELSPLTVNVAHSAVHRHISLAPLLRFYRLGQELVWQWFFARIVETARDSEEQARALSLATGWIFAYADAAMTRAEEAYEAEQETWLRGAAAARAATIEEVTTGREQDQTRASTRLRYPLNRHHLGVFAWLEEAPRGGDAHPALGEAIASFSRVVEAENTLVHAVGTLAVAAWLSSRRAFTPERLSALDELRTAPTHPDVRIAVGGPGLGLEGFRRTHLEATHARRVASLIAADSAGITRYEKVAVAALGTADPELASSFVTRVLGPLADDDETTYRVAMTLAVFLGENQSRSRSAERLTVHPNTVSYRVRQAEEILGRSIDVDTLDLQVALALLPALRGLQTR